MGSEATSSAQAYEELRQLWVDNSDDLMGTAVDLDASPAGAMQVTEDAFVDLFKGWKRNGGSLDQLRSYVEEHAAAFADHTDIPDGWKSVSDRCREVVWFTRPRWVNVVVIAGALLVAGALLLTLLDTGGDDGDVTARAGATTVVPAPSTTLGELPDDLVDPVDLRGQSTVDIAVNDNSYDPRTIIVSPGTEVVFSNEGQNLHNVTPAEDGAFEGLATDQLDVGSSSSITFETPGDYPYFCSIHGSATRGQRGRVVVG